MGKLEFENIRKLLKIRLRDCSGIPVISTLFGIVFLIDTINLIHMTNAYQAEVNLISPTVYSHWALFLIIIASIYYTFNYGEYNENHQIFPQSTSTQLISFELYCFLINIITQALALGLYLLQYLLCMILNQINGTVKLAYEFNLSFMVTGFFVNLVYCMLLISFIIMIAVFVRKLRWWALAIYVAVFLLLWQTRDANITGSIINFYTLEASPLLFFVKAIGTLLILEALIQLINRHTGIIRARKYFIRHIIIASIILISFLLNAFLSLSIRTSSNDFNWSQGPDIDITKDTPAFVIDTGSLSSDSYLQVDTNLIKNCNINIHEYSTSDNKIKIFYVPNKNISNYLNLTAFTNPEIAASLSGNRLRIMQVYTENIKVIALYPYSTALQFDCYKDKPYARQNSFISMGGSTMGKLEICIPEGISYTSQINNTNISY